MTHEHLEAREKLADAIVNVIEHYRSADDIEYHVADAVFAAMPGMVKPLEWILVGDWDYRAGEYSVWLYQAKPTPEPVWVLFTADQVRSAHPTEEAAISAANAHHVAQVMAALGVAV